MTLFSSFTCPEGKGLDAGKVITTPPGLLDFHLGYYPVCVCDQGVGLEAVGPPDGAGSLTASLLP